MSDSICGYCGAMAGGDELVLNVSCGDLLCTILLLEHCGLALFGGTAGLEFVLECHFKLLKLLLGDLCYASLVSIHFLSKRLQINYHNIVQVFIIWSGNVIPLHMDWGLAFSLILLSGCCSFLYIDLCNLAVFILRLS